MSNIDIPLTCYEDIIGLSRTTCPCEPLNLYDESKSDLYLDELQGLNLKSLTSLENCEDSNNIWVIMDRARTNAILTTISDITAELMKTNKVKRQPFIGAIGRKHFTKDKSINHTYAGVRWYCADIVSGNLKIKKIHTLFNQTGTIQLSIYNSLNELVQAPITLNCVANQATLNTLSTPIDLPSHNSFVDNIEYFFVYALPAGWSPKNNDVECLTGCSGFYYTFDTCKPYFWSQTNKKKGWANYIMSGSWSGNDLTSFDNLGSTTDGHMNGLLFEVEFGCKYSEVICRDSLDFINNTMAITLAFMVQHKAGELLLTDWMMGSNINREAMINAETANGLIGFYQKKYQEYLKAIMRQIDIKATDCFECKDFIEMTKRGILA